MFAARCAEIEASVAVAAAAALVISDAAVAVAVAATKVKSDAEIAHLKKTVDDQCLSRGFAYFFLGVWASIFSLSLSNYVYV